ncbi:hypothetical protein GCM10009799_11270 [Nocardiopsis rhodophaea]|uniref:Methyltransferase n=1 Tax=Nocardiopsis rhodophaea TaxID=280238 RepID=A0ABN2SIN5_9ACTN
MSVIDDTQRFNDLAGLYERFRPSYPRAALDRITAYVRAGTAARGGGPALLIDVGAGTGISARALRAAFGPEPGTTGMLPAQRGWLPVAVAASHVMKVVECPLGPQLAHTRRRPRSVTRCDNPVIPSGQNRIPGRDHPRKVLVQGWRFRNAACPSRAAEARSSGGSAVQMCPPATVPCPLPQPTSGRYSPARTGPLMSTRWRAGVPHPAAVSLLPAPPRREAVRRAGRRRRWPGAARSDRRGGRRTRSHAAGRYRVSRAPGWA